MLLLFKKALQSKPLKLDTAYFAALFLFSFIIYLKSLCGSVYLDDSGETATVAALLGLGHPPGYPLHTLLARLAVLLLPGSPAFCLNLLSSLLASLCVASFGLLALQMGELALPNASRRILLMSSAAASLGLALGPVYWHQALVAKGSIYHLNNLFSILLLMALLAARKGGPQASRRALGLFWLGLGLGLAHHYMSQLVLLPAYGLLLVAPLPGSAAWPLRLRKSLALSWLALPGISLYAYLPLRTLCHPAVAWSGVSSFSDLLFNLSRAQYAASEGARSAWVVLAQVRTIFMMALREGQFLGPALALLAAWLLIRAKSPLRWALVLGAAFPFMAAAGYFNLDADRLWVMKPHLFPGYLMQALLAALGLAWLAARAARPWRGLLLALPLALSLSLGAAFWPEADLSHWHYALDAARNLMLTAPKGAVLYLSGDSMIFPLWYLQRYEQRRADLCLVGIPVLPMRWVREDLARWHPELRQPLGHEPMGVESVAPLVQGMLRLNWGERPQFAGYNKKGPELEGYELLPCGALFQVCSPSAARDASQRATAPPEALFAAYNSRGISQGSQDPDTRKLFINDAAIIHNSYGTWLEDGGAYGPAGQQYQEAARICPWDAQFPYNCGNASFRQKQYALAESWYRQSLQLDPGYADAHFNLAVDLQAQGRGAECRHELEEVLRLDPSRAEVRSFLGMN